MHYERIELKIIEELFFELFAQSYITTSQNEFEVTVRCHCTEGFDPTIGAEKANFFIWTVHLDFTSVPPCIWLVRTAKSLRLAESKSAEPLSTWIIFTPI